MLVLSLFFFGYARDSMPRLFCLFAFILAGDSKVRECPRDDRRREIKFVRVFVRAGESQREKATREFTEWVSCIPRGRGEAKVRQRGHDGPHPFALSRIINRQPLP